METVINEERITKRRTPFFSVTTFQPSVKSLKNEVCTFIFSVPSPFLTTAVEIIVRPKVAISMTSNKRISETANRRPARNGEIKYLALPARLTRPLAFANSSFVSKSDIVALYDGSKSDEKTELTVTPM